MTEAGRRVEGLLSREKLLDLLRPLDDDRLLEVLEQVVHHREDARIYCAQMAERVEKSNN